MWGHKILSNSKPIKFLRNHLVNECLESLQVCSRQSAAEKEQRRLALVYVCVRAALCAVATFPILVAKDMNSLYACVCVCCNKHFYAHDQP